MEEKIEKMYYEFKCIVKKALAGLFIGIIVLMLIVSMFLGSPFLYKEEVLFFSFWQKGWFFEKNSVYYLILAVVFIPTFIWELYEMKKELNVFRDMLYKECDALGLLEAAKLGIELLKQMKYRYLYEKVSAEYIMGCCYYELGEYSEAAEHLMFVMEYGNTRIAKEKAIELCQRIV